MQIGTREEREKANIEIAEPLKLVPDAERQEQLRQLLDNLGIHETELERLRIMLSWNEVKQMAQDGITMGSHGHTHSILSRMAIEKAKEDILNSKKIIEEKLGVQVKHFAFPNGREEDFSEELRGYYQEIGFESVSTAV